MFSTAKGTLIIKRGRDEIDRRRRIFRSLASVPSPGQEVNEEDMKRLPTMEAADELDDLLDVLVSIQPRPRAKMIPMTREELRPIAANLSSAQPSLEDLKLGRDDLYLLMKLMLVLQLNGIDRDHLEQFLKCLPELDTVTNHLLNAFTQHHQAINYATFETVIQTTMPYLFHGVPWLFLTFLKAPPPPAATSTPPFPLSTQILNLTLLSQLSLFLHYPRAHRAADRALFPGRTRFGNLRLISQPNKDYTAVHLASVIQNEPSACILLLSANTSSALSGPAIFGSYIPNAQQDSPRNSTSSEERSIFQLRPTHRVFRAESITPTSVIHGTHKHLGQPCLTFETGSASLCVDETLSSGILTHCEQDRELGAGGVAAEIRFRVVAIEVWAL
ncbi:hypothetical protein MMC18_003139 [Xylographa bjoerkii]|nr:hypothetical protein [Xylographa bjoerkii]